MADTIQKLIEYEFAGPCGAFVAGQALVAGFVQISGTAYTVVQSGQSSTRRPIGIATNSYSSAKTVTVIDRGIVNLISNCAMSAGQPVYPAAVAGRVCVTGKSYTSSVPYFSQGFGTVVKGGASSTVVQVKLQII